LRRDLLCSRTSDTMTFARNGCCVGLFAFFIHCACVRAQVLDVRLAPPKRPLPQVAAEIAALENQRESAEKELVKSLKAASTSVLATARHEVAISVASGLRAASDMGRDEAQPAFLQSLAVARQKRSDADGFDVKLSTAAAPVPDDSIQALMEKIEFKREDAETRVFEQACSEMSALKKIALNTLEAQLRAFAATSATPISFLSSMRHKQQSQLPDMTNVRVGASSDVFPTIGDLVEGMEGRRDVAESQGRALIIETEMNMLQELNSVMKEELSAQIQRVMVDDRVRDATRGL